MDSSVDGSIEKHDIEKNDDEPLVKDKTLPFSNNNNNSSTTAIDVNMADDDDDEDDDEYYYSKRLKIVEEEIDEKNNLNNEQISLYSSLVTARKSPVNQLNEAVKTEEVIENVELSKTPSPLPPLTYTSEQQLIAIDNQSNNSESSLIDSIENDQSCLKVPPLKIICSKGDFSLVTDENLKVDSEGIGEEKPTVISNSIEASALLIPHTIAISIEEKKVNENEVASNNKKDTTIILRKTTTNNNDNNVTYEVPATRSSRNQQPSGISINNKRILRDTISTNNPQGSTRSAYRNAIVASPISDQQQQSMKLTITSATNKQADTTTATSTTAIIRRKLRSHTRQQQGSGALSPSNTTSATSNSSADFVDVNLDDGDELNKNKETEVSAASDMPVDETIPTTTRKRKVRQQHQISENSSDGNIQAYSKEFNSTVSSSSSSSTNSQSMCVTTGLTTNNTVNSTQHSVLQQLPIQFQQRVFLNTNNCIKQFIEIRNEIIKRRELLKKNTTEPKLPKNYEEFSLVKKNYLIKGNKEAYFSIPFCPIPSQISEEMKELYTKQEKDRFNLQIRQRVEQDKIQILYEHEVLRSFNQSCKDGNKYSHLSFCTIIKDDEIYSLNHISSQQAANNDETTTPVETSTEDDEESSLLLLTFLKQNLSDLEQKFQRLKDDLIKRQLHESDSLHAVQLMDWQSKLKQVNNSNKLIVLNSDDLHVPIVTVNSKFELTPVRTR